MQYMIAIMFFMIMIMMKPEINKNRLLVLICNSISSRAKLNTSYRETFYGRTCYHFLIKKKYIYSLDKNH